MIAGVTPSAHANPEPSVTITTARPTTLATVRPSHPEGLVNRVHTRRSLTTNSAARPQSVPRAVTCPSVGRSGCQARTTGRT